MARAFKCDICEMLFEDAINDLNEISFCMDRIITFINDNYKDENRKIKRNYN